MHGLFTDDIAVSLVVKGSLGRSRMINGVYGVLDDSHWSSRPAYQKVPRAEDPEASGFQKFLFFVTETGHWVLGAELHSPRHCLARNGPGRWAALTPDHCAYPWELFNGKGYAPDSCVSVRAVRAPTAGSSPTPRAVERSLSPQCPEVAAVPKVLPPSVPASGDRPQAWTDSSPSSPQTPATRGWGSAHHHRLGSPRATPEVGGAAISRAPVVPRSPSPVPGKQSAPGTPAFPRSQPRGAWDPGPRAVVSPRQSPRPARRGASPRWTSPRRAAPGPVPNLKS